MWGKLNNVVISFSSDFRSAGVFLTYQIQQVSEANAASQLYVITSCDKRSCNQNFVDNSVGGGLFFK